MKKGKVFFHPIEGSGCLTISWSSEPKGDAVEAELGDGVGFFSDRGDLLCVIFDEVQSDEDRQVLEFPHYKIEVAVKNGRPKFTLTQPKRSKRIKRKKVVRKKRVRNT